VVPQRVDSVLVRVSNLDKALTFYRTLYGKEASRNGGAAQFSFRNGSRLLLEQVNYTYDGGGPVRIARFGILVKPFDRAAVAAAIPQLGGKLVKDDGKVLRLTDADGIELELATGA
jgi:catechol 2,3-dioxygenase-like lactoylglutathione lyase family enzyme